MSRIPNASLFPPELPASSNPNSDALGNVDLDQFLNLMIAELQNQDPLDPLDNSEMLAQITQIREIGATDQLRDTLSSLSSGQSLATAGGLIGKQVTALSNEGGNVEGVVDRVSVAVNDETGARSVRLHIGEDNVELKNVREILSV